MQFAGIAARIAETSAKWASDVLSHANDQPMRRLAAERFVAEIREKLEWIEAGCNG
jgi:hypothetical protein